LGTKILLLREIRSLRGTKKIYFWRRIDPPGIDPRSIGICPIHRIRNSLKKQKKRKFLLSTLYKLVPTRLFPARAFSSPIYLHICIYICIYIYVYIYIYIYMYIYRSEDVLDPSVSPYRIDRSHDAAPKKSSHLHPPPQAELLLSRRKRAEEEEAVEL
jgi:hypothetical protein